MAMFQRERSNLYRKWFVIFAVSFLFGILLMNGFRETLLTSNGIFNDTAVNRLKYAEVNSGNFFWYVLKKRMKGYLLFGLLSTTFLGFFTVYAEMIRQGVLMGMTMTAAVIRFGVKGMLFIFASFFPQQLLLIPAGIMMLLWAYQNCTFLYFPSRNLWPAYRSAKRQWFRQFLMVLWIFGVVIIGCVLESYVNPLIMTDVSKFF